MHGPEPTRDVLSAMLGAIDVGSLLPDEYDAYREPIADTLAFFLAQLDPDRCVEILAEQAAMPLQASAADRLVALMHHCPTLHKLGQIVARDRRLDAHLRAQLQRLESGPPRVGVDWIGRIAEEQLDPAALARLSLDETALAEASVAVVVSGRWHQGDAPTADIVLKVLKPSVHKSLDEELAILSRVGTILDERIHRYGMPELSYAAAFDEVRNLLSHEVNLENEQNNLRRARHLYADLANVDVPEPIDLLCAPRVTGMSRLRGVKVTDQPALSEAQRRQLAATLVEALLVRPLFDPAPITMFHADPHAGNLLADDDGRLGILDWSLVGNLTKDVRETFALVLRGAVALDHGTIAGAIESLGTARVCPDRLAAIVESALAELRLGSLPGITWLVRLLDRAVMGAGVSLDGNLMAFRKMLLTLEGVLADVCASHRTDWVLLAAAMTRLQREWPARCWSPWNSRAFGTHLSTADLVSLSWTAPQAIMRFWSQSWSEWAKTAFGPPS